MYGDDLEHFVRERVLNMPAVSCEGQFWAGCFLVSRRILDKVSLFRTDKGLAADEDAIWFSENIEGRYRSAVFNRSYVHHFQIPRE